MGKYAKAVTEVLNNLTHGERREYMALAEEWNKSRPPTEVQIRSVPVKGLGLDDLINHVSQCRQEMCNSVYGVLCGTNG